jgi:hypothetical protein
MQKVAAGAGAAVLMGITFAGPALAKPDSNEPVGSVATVPNQGPPVYNTWQGATSVPNQGPPSYNSWPSLAHDVSPAGASTATSSVAVDLTQLAWGALGGATVAGAAALLAGTALGRRRAIHA